MDKKLARGGWSSGTRRDIYMTDNPATNFPAGVALTGWPNPNPKVEPPCFDGIKENLDLLAKFVTYVAPTNISFFK